MSDVYFKASLQNTLNPEVGTFDNVNNKEGTFTLEDGEYYLTNNTSNSYRVYYPTKDIYSVGFTIEFDINYNNNSGFKWCLLFNGDDSTYWHGFSLESSILRYVGNGISNYDLITSTNTWLHVKCIFDYYLNQNAVHIYIDNVEVNTFTISKDYGIKYIDILGNSGGYVADAKIKNIIIYNSSKKHYLDTIGLTTFWSKIKSLFATKTELGSKANDSDVVHKSGDETIKGNKYFDGNFVDVNGYRLRVKGTNQEVGVIPTDGNKWNGFSFYDKNNKQTFAIENGHLANGNTMLNFSLTRNLTDSTLFNYESVRFFKDGENCEKSLNCDVYPNVNNKYVLGISSLKWKDVYATTFHGNLVGNADTSTKATNNASGNELSNNIIKGLSVSGKVITYTKLDGSTGTITTQDTNTDTKVTNTLGNTTKAYITGTTSATTNTGTQIFDSGVYLTTTAGQLHADIDFPITEAQVNEILGIS